MKNDPGCRWNGCSVQWRQERGVYHGSAHDWRLVNRCAEDWRSNYMHRRPSGMSYGNRGMLRRNKCFQSKGRAKQEQEISEDRAPSEEQHTILPTNPRIARSIGTSLNLYRTRFLRRAYGNPREQWRE